MTRHAKPVYHICPRCLGIARPTPCIGCKGRGVIKASYHEAMIEAQKLARRATRPVKA
jgi:hypothetical protein